MFQLEEIETHLSLPEHWQIQFQEPLQASIIAEGDYIYGDLTRYQNLFADIFSEEQVAGYQSQVNSLHISICYPEEHAKQIALPKYISVNVIDFATILFGPKIYQVALVESQSLEILRQKLDLNPKALTFRGQLVPPHVTLFRRDS